MQTNPPILSPRLMAVASLVENCECFADVGTDHAYLPVYLYMTDKCKSAVASDIADGPIKRAKQTISRYGLENIISVRKGGGLDTIKDGEADVISIAGMGGIEITKILAGGADKIKVGQKIILQPMTSLPELRDFLWKNKFKTECELITKEDKKLYNIICVSKSATDKPLKAATQFELYFGIGISKDNSESFDDYVKMHIEKIKKIIAGLDNSSTNNSNEKLEYYSLILKELENL